MTPTLDRRGATLPLTILMVLLLSVIVAAGFSRVSSERRVNADMNAQVDAYAIAMSGLQQYMAGVTSAPAATVVDSVTGLTGGKAYINIWQLRASAGGNPAIYVITSRGVNTTAQKYDPSSPAAERTVAQYATWLPASFTVSSAWTSITGLHKNGGSGTISGTDNCGAASAVAGVAVPTTAADGGAGYNQNGGSSVPSGSPAISNIGANTAAAANSVPVDWNAIRNGNAITPTVTINSGTAGWPSSFPAGYWPTIYVRNGDNGNFTLPSDGQGMLIVEGNVTISGSTQWKGIILVGGTLTSNGNNTVLGAVVTGLNVKLGKTVGVSDVGNGTKTYRYDSCNVANALNNFASFVALRNGMVDNWPTY
jgi:hypothetical protein